MPPCPFLQTRMTDDASHKLVSMLLRLEQYLVLIAVNVEKARRDTMKQTTVQLLQTLLSEIILVIGLLHATPEVCFATPFTVATPS